MTTFCWLPPESVVIGSLGVAELDPQAVDVARPGARACAPATAGRGERSRSSVAMPKFSRIGLRLEQRLSAALARDVGDALATAQRLQERVLPVALEAGQPDELAGAEGQPGHLRARPRPAARCGRVGGLRGRGVRRRSSAAPAPRRSRSWRSSVATVSPQRITVQRSPISAISSIRCEMNTTAAPAVTRSRTSAKSRSRVGDIQRRGGLVEDQDLRVAHQRRGPGSRPVDRSATAPRRACRAEARRRAAPRGPRRARCRSRAAGTPVRNSPSVPIQTLSSTDRGSTTSTSWKTVATPAAAERRGDATRSSRSPPISIDPASGRWTPARIFTSVDLPDPFSPTMQCTSPPRSSNEQSFSAGWPRTP